MTPRFRCLVTLVAIISLVSDTSFAQRADRGAATPAALGFPRGNGLSGQRPTGDSVVLRLIARTEAEGAAFKRHPPSEGPPAFTTARGSSERVCVVGDEMGPVRSGDFLIGGNLGGSEAMHSGKPGKVWWSPLNNSKDMPPLLVRGRSLRSLRDTFRFTTSKVAFPVKPGSQHAANRDYFFPSGITIPSPGRWLLVATSGSNWGCFVLTTN